MTASLEYLAKGHGPLTPKRLKQIQKWIDDDWESHDIERDARKLIQRLVDTATERKKRSK